MTPRERALLRAYRGLSEARQASVLDYIEFLASREAEPASSPVPQSPQSIPRPDEESVIRAVKRLTQTYPMVDRNALLHETSALVSQHVMHKRPAQEVIDQLESLFQRHYNTFLEKNIPSQG